jgi:hypothetical protein
MLARRLTTILPAMTLAEAIETTRIHSVAALTGERTAFVTPHPFRAPHHTISDVGLIGDRSDVADLANRLLTASRSDRVQEPPITTVPVSTIEVRPPRPPTPVPGVTSCFSLDTGPALEY